MPKVKKMPKIPGLPIMPKVMPAYFAWPYVQVYNKFVEDGIDPATRRGRAVQVDPIKPVLKAPGSERLKLKM
jgi:hypothetical protein